MTKRFTYSIIPAFTVIAGVAILVYSNTFSSPFVFDDAGYIVHNPAVKSFQYYVTPSLAGKIYGIKNIAVHFYTRIAVFFTFAVNYSVGGLNVAGYHITNLAVHIVNATLVYALVRAICATPLFAKSSGRFVPLFAALLFVCHPAQTQAVGYITQRFTLMATMFYLIAALAYVRWRTAGSWLWYAVAVSAAVIGMFCKEIMFTAPVCVAAMELIFFTGSIKKRAVYLAPLLVTMTIIPAVMLYNGGHARSMTEVATVAAGESVSAWRYFITQFPVMVTYLRLLVLPANQNLDYDYPVYDSLLQPAVAMSALFLVMIIESIIPFLIFRRGEYRLAAFGVLWFFIAISVESSVIPLADVVFEHRLYLPSVGLFISASVMAGELRERFRVAITLAAVMAVAVFSVAAHARNEVWQSEKTLWQDAANKSPGKGRPVANLATVYEREGNLDEAEKLFRRLLSNNPRFMKAYLNLGRIYEKRGLYDKAVTEYEAALAVNPGYSQAHLAIGLSRQRAGDFEKAERAYKKALEINPDYAEVRANLGLLYASAGRYDDALKEYAEALRLNPDNAETHVNLGLLYLARGDLDHAIAEQNRAITIDPASAAAYSNLGKAFALKGDFESAARYFGEALLRDPDSAAIKENLEIAGSLRDKLNNKNHISDMK